MGDRRLPLPRLVIFDLDGTLVDSVPDIAVALNAALADLALPGIGIDQVRHWVGNGAHVLARRALARDFSAEADPAAVEALYRRFLHRYSDRVCEQTRVYEGVIECLAHLRERKCDMAVVTNKPHALADELLRLLGLDHWFGQLLGGDSLPEKKPAPGPLLHAMEQAGAGAQETLMVGDSVSDVAAARAAGVTCGCVSYGYNHGDDVETLGADFVVDSLADLSRLFVDEVKRA